jgi:N-carbamoyl-L-amino-acid hydrolase
MGSPENNISRNPPRFYVELHIEQGPELYSKGYDIGIPQGIVGIRVVELAFRGSQDHASSPLWARRDALTGLVIVKSRLEEYALERVDKLRVTIGRVNVEPNVANVVPGEVRFTVDIRSYDPNIIDETVKYIVENGEDVARRRGLDFEHRDLWYIERTLFDTQVVKTIEEACEELEFKCLKMWSWAGHDAQNMARVSRTGMIFIPSVNGRSHSKDEYSRDEDLVKGLLMLLNVVLALDSS